MARLGAAMKCIQLMIFLLNLVFLMVGVFLIAIGSAILANYYDFDIFFESPHFKPAQISIACGAILLFISLVGFIAAFKKSSLAVNIYGLLLFLVLILEISLAVVAFAMRCDIVDDLEYSMKDALNNYTTGDPFRNAWDFTQENLHCCGVHQLRDWESQHVDGPMIERNGTSFTVPYSCCVEERSCKSVYDRGCLDVLGSYADDATTIMVYIGIGFAVVQLFSVLFAFMLARRIRRAKTEEEIERQLNRQRIYEQALSRHASPPFLHVSSTSDA